ncbi:MAG: metal ABC transporter permease [Actinomycetota bacterium]|nr:metal ABC transporter permease [Actinomycetota bacterium]
MAAAPPSPLELVDLAFTRSALAELALLAVAGGLLSVWIVVRHLAFFTHAAGTATFPGLVVAEAAGTSPRLAALAVAGGYAGAVGRRPRRPGEGGDTTVALLLVVALAGGVVLAGDVFSSGAGIDTLLFGTLIGVEGGDLAVSAVVAALAVGGTVLLGPAWAAAGFDAEAARAGGLPVRRADLCLLVLVAATVVAALPAVGALLVTSLLVVPAAAARLLCDRLSPLLSAAVALALVQGVAGLYLALWLDVPPGPTVAAVGGVGFTAVACLSRPARVA